MKRMLIWCLVVSLVIFIPFTVYARGGGGKQYRGGGEATSTSDDGGSDNGGRPDDVEGPLNDKKSDQGALYGDLYVILRYLEKDAATGAVGGQPILSQQFGWYAKEVEEGVYEPALSDVPCECVQPVASYEKWGDLSPVTGFSQNRIPLVATYDATWGRSECEIGVLNSTPTANADGTLNLDIDPYFIEPGGEWYHPLQERYITYPEGVMWTDLIQEVHFGRLNLARSPDAVLDAAFDEAIMAINNAKEIRIDASGRLLLVREVYSDVYVDPNTGMPLYLGDEEKAIDSPLENLALYTKLMKDGHLITPGDERSPIDRSEMGGIPPEKAAELEDGPSDALRPTIDIDKIPFEFRNLVDAAGIREYYTYMDVDNQLVVSTSCPGSQTCESSIGIMTDDGGSPQGNDFPFAASFLAAAADKTGKFGMDMVVYLNSILGINEVLGDSEPAYFDFVEVSGYNRDDTFGHRGQMGDDGYNGSVRILVPGSAQWTWIEEDVNILDNVGFRNMGVDTATRAPSSNPAANDILGFAQMADDDLSVIEFVHTYQIPGAR